MTTLSQNLFNMNGNMIAGTLVVGNGVITAEFYSATGTDTCATGEAVIVVSTVNGLVTKVAKGAGLTAGYVGVVVCDPMKESYAVGEKMSIALIGCIVMMTVSAAVTAGQVLQYATATGKVVLNASIGTNTTLGRAMENATADGQLIRVLLTAV